MLGIVPAAGRGSRIQPLGCSKELLPVGMQFRDGRLKPRAVAEYLLDRMLLAGADRIAMVLSPEKSDLLRYFAETDYSRYLFFVLQPEPEGLCDAVFRAVPHVRPDEAVLIGLPDTIWMPNDLFSRAPREQPHLITFPVAAAEQFDAVISQGSGPIQAVARVEVKQSGNPRRRIWGGVTLPGECLLEMAAMWQDMKPRPHYLGDLFNSWLAAGRSLSCDAAGQWYLDVGTLEGYHQALDWSRRERPLLVAERDGEACGAPSRPPAIAAANLKMVK